MVLVRPWIAVVALPLFTGCLVACAEAPRPKSAAPEYPQATPATAPAAGEEQRQAAPKTGAASDADGDLAQIAAAQVELESLGLGGAGGKKKAESGASPPKDAARGMAEKPQANACTSACRALGSMSRATDHLCSIAGESDARCTDARARTRAADGLVKGSCSC